MYTDSRLYEASVLVNGRPITEVFHNGITHLEGRKNSHFTLRFSNWGWKRVLVIPSVDGLNVIDRKSCGTNSQGYVVNARSTLEIPGWTLDANGVGKFIFKAQGAPEGRNQSLAEALDEPENQGAIGFMVFEEKIQTLVIKHCWEPGGNFYGGSYGNGYGTGAAKQFDFGNTVIGSTGDEKGGGPVMDALSLNDSYSVPTSYSSSVKTKSSTRRSQQSKRGITEGPGNKLKGMAEPVSEPSLGTGIGKEVEFKTQEVQFERESSHPSAVLTFRYDNLSNLKRMGVPTHLFRPAAPRDEVNPFPASPEVVERDDRLPTWYKRRNR